jgi:pyridoxal kinase
VFDHPAVQRHRALAGVCGVVEGGDDLAGPDELDLGRGEGGVRWPNLGGMDQRLAVKPQRAAAPGFVRKSVRILIGVIDRVQRRQSKRPGRQDQTAQMRFQRRASARPVGQAQPFGQVIGAGDQRSQPVPRGLSGDGVDLQHGARGLDHRPERAVKTRAVQPLAHGGQLLGGLQLGDQHRIGLGLSRHRQVGRQIRRTGLGDAQDGTSARLTEACNGRRRGGARLGFPRWRDRIFKVKDQRIRAQARRFLDGARLVAGHKQGRPQRRRETGIVTHGGKAYKRGMSNATPQPRPAQPSVITLSSLVAGSQVGGAVTNAVLFAHGVRSQFLPTIILSRHPGLGAPGGGAVDTGLIRAALTGLAEHGRFTVADAVFTGYFTRPDQVEAAAEAIAAAKAERPDLLVMVDPIIGDGPADARNDRLYVSAQTAAAIRDRLVPRADVITPNRFELSWLSGRPIEAEADAVAAARALAPVTLVTSAPAGEGEVAVLVVEAQDATRLTSPRMDGAPNGTGDLFAASALAAHIDGADWRRAAGLAMARVSHVLEATLASDPADLLLTPETLRAPVAAPRPVRVGARRPAWVMGLDGCRGGWAAVMVDLNGLEAPQRALFETFDAALSWGAQVHAVDMPIGFEDQSSGAGGRVCEREARTRLGARRSSIFASPLRPALAATSHDQASALNRAAGGPGLSRQSFISSPKCVRSMR